MNDIKIKNCMKSNTPIKKTVTEILSHSSCRPNKNFKNLLITEKKY